LYLASYFSILSLIKNIFLKNVLTEKIKRLLYLNKKNNRKRTMLVLAALLGNKAIVQLLLKKGADIKAKDSDRITALFQAALLGNEAIV
jgi:ankyrin repeat protein